MSEDVDDRLSAASGDEWKHNDVHTECSTFFHVLPQMRVLDQTLYSPLFFTFGPYHAKRPSPSYNLKLKVAKQLCPRPAHFSHLVDSICARDPDIRHLYQEPWHYESQLRLQPRTLALILALDALTLIAGACYPDVHKLLGTALIQRDACLLENQLPLFVLEAAINATEANKAVGQEKVTLQDVVKFYALEAAAGLFYQKPLQADDWPNSWRLDMEESMLNSIHHTIFLQGSARRAHKEKAKRDESWLTRLPVFGYCMCRSQKEEDVEAQAEEEEHVKDMKDSTSHERLSTASKLRRCGIKFAAGSGRGFTGIRFDKATRTLTLPKITVIDETQTYLLNLMAHEAWCTCQPVISYTAFMDYLIDGEEDVKVLVDRNIINNQLGSHSQLASMWNQLMRFVPLNITNEDAKVIIEVNKASKDKWRRWFTEVVDTYFVKKPWLLISIIAALFLFVFTFLQTFYIILQYQSPNS